MSLIGSVVSTAVDKISEGVLKKMDESEAQRDREFSYKLKELEFYKGNYDKEIKSVFDRWFDLLKSALPTNKEKTASGQQKNAVAKVKGEDYRKQEKVRELLIDTIKYGGTETGKALAVFCQISYYNSKKENSPLFIVYAICVLLSTLKKEILGQEIAPETILKILMTDFVEESNVIEDSRAYVEEVRISLFPEDNDDGAIV